jgi:hypothetical protein
MLTGFFGSCEFSIKMSLLHVRNDIIEVSDIFAVWSVCIANEKNN